MAKKRIAILAVSVLLMSVLSVIIIANYRITASSADYLTPLEYNAFSADAITDTAAYAEKHKMPETQGLSAQIYKFDDLFADEYDCLTKLEVNYTKYPFNIGATMFDYAIRKYPTANLRVYEENGRKNTYLVYMTDNGYTLYLFFGSDAVYQRGYAILMSKVLNYGDFNGIKVGSTINDVGAVDSAAYVMRDIYTGLSGDLNGLGASPKDYMSYTTTHLLTDGVLTIRYSRENGNYFVSDMIYNSDFYVEGLNIDGVYDEVRYDWYKIYPGDYATDINSMVASGDKGLNTEPDTQSSEDAVWSIEVDYDGSSMVYTKSDAEQSAGKKVFASSYPDGKPENGIITRMYEGVLFSDVLNRIGIKQDINTVVVTDTDGKEHSFTADTALDGQTILAWRENGDKVITGSDSGVAFCAGSEAGAFVSSVKSIRLE